MKKYPKLVQCDKRGQIVIPKDIRNELKIDEGAGFWVYSILDEGILLKKIEAPSLENDRLANTVERKSSKLGLKKDSVKKTINKYKKKKDGRLELL